MRLHPRAACPPVGSAHYGRLAARPLSCGHAPEQPGEASYAKWKEEKDSLYSALSRKSKMVHTKLNAIEGVSCQMVEGAMYAFPKIEMPPGAIAAAEAAGHPPDTFYALSLLEQTGLCTVPGNGFGQKEGGMMRARASARELCA